MKDYRVGLLAGLVLFGAFLGASACSSPDPGSITFTERPSGTGGDTSSSSTGGGTTTTGDAGSGTKITSDAIFGTTTFTYTYPGLDANGANPAHNKTVVGKDCAVNSGCHGTDSKKPWTFCGTLYGAGGTATVAKGEVRVVDADGGAVGSAYTDANGNFWYEGAALPANSKVGARADGVAAAQHMSGTLLATNNGCSSANCHGAPAQGPVHVP